MREYRLDSSRWLKLDFSLFEQTPGVSANMGWGVSEQCWMYQIFCGVSLNSHNSPHFLGASLKSVVIFS